jgi:ADP-heptose:LPS heptosyltransferase
MVAPINPSFPQWRGEPLAGKSVLIWVEQGFGDQIQFARFANEMKARGAAKITLACRPALARLFTTLRGVDEVMSVATGANVAVAPHDYWSRYFSLPEHLRITLQNLPSAPYLSVPPGTLAPVPQGRVGLAWRASPTGFNGAAKGLPDDLAQRLLEAGVISLDPADTGAADFADTAAIIAQLDLVISIDTSVAHLAGAMGKPCWTLLPYLHTDWRWLRGRADSPWYPSMRLYRQTAPDDWSPVIAEVTTALRAEGYIQ